MESIGRSHGRTGNRRRSQRQRRRRTRGSRRRGGHPAIPEHALEGGYEGALWPSDSKRTASMVRSERPAATPDPTCHNPTKLLILRQLLSSPTPAGERDGRKRIPSTPSCTTFPRTHHAAPPEHDHGVAVHPRRSPPPAPPRRWRTSFPLVRRPNRALLALVQAKLSFSETVLSLLPHLFSGTAP